MIEDINEIDLSSIEIESYDKLSFKAGEKIGRKERDAEIIDIIEDTFLIGTCKCNQCAIVRDVIKQIKEKEQ